MIEGAGHCLNNTVTINSDYAIIGWDRFDVSGTLTYTTTRPTANFVPKWARITGTVRSESPFALVTLGNSGNTIDILGTVSAPDVLLSANSIARLDIENAAREFLRGGILHLKTDVDGTSRLTIDGGHIESTAEGGNVRLVARSIDLERRATVSSQGDIQFAGASNVVALGDRGTHIQMSSAGGSIRIGGNSELSGRNVQLLAFNGDRQDPPVRAIVNRGIINVAIPEGRVFVRVMGAGGAFLHNGEGNKKAVINGSLELGELTTLTGSGLINPSGSDPAPAILVSVRRNDEKSPVVAAVASGKRDKKRQKKTARRGSSSSNSKRKPLAGSLKRTRR